MSDAGKAPGDPVEDPRPEDGDVVGHAHEGLASAEAAQRDIDSAPAARRESSAAAASPSTAEEDDSFQARYAGYVSPDPHTESDAGGAPVAAAPAATSSVATTAAPSSPATSPVSEPPAVERTAVSPAATAAPQPIFVQAPEAPRPRGNRAAAGLIGLLAALCFAVLYLACALGFELIAGSRTPDTFVDGVVAALTSWWLWVTTAVFFLGFWLLGAVINRGRWAHWVIWGLLVGFVAYGGHLLGQLFQAPFWQVTRTEGTALVEEQLVAPLAFAAFVIGRELTIWFGAWVAARGKRVSELNSEAQREYERTLEAGPTLVRA